MRKHRLIAAGAVLTSAALATVAAPVAGGLDPGVGEPRVGAFTVTRETPDVAAPYWANLAELANAVDLNRFYEAQAAALRPRSGGRGGGCSEQDIIDRESGGNPQAVNSSSGAGGLYQILPSTWAGRGGYENAADAPVELQQEAYHEIRASNPSAWGSSGC